MVSKILSNKKNRNRETPWRNEDLFRPMNSNRNERNCNSVANRDQTEDGTHPPEKANADEIHSHLDTTKVKGEQCDTVVETTTTRPLKSRKYVDLLIFMDVIDNF